MFFLAFGSGTKHKAWDLSSGYTLLCVYDYFHLFYLLRFVTEKEWYLQGDSRSEDRELSLEQLLEILPTEPVVSAYD